MGLLDDLKQQADSVRQKAELSQGEISQNLLIAHDKLKDALHYWNELFNSLNVIKPTISRVYYLEGGAVRMEGMLQSEYNVNGRRQSLDHKDYFEAIVLRFRCASDQKLVIEKQTDPLVQRMREHLWSNNLKFEVKEVRNDRGYVERGIFTINCEVAVTVTIVADLEHGRMQVATKNLEKFGEYTNTYDFDEFGKEVLEEIGKVIIAKPNNFRSMGRHQESMRTSTTRVPRQPSPSESQISKPVQPESPPAAKASPPQAPVAKAPPQAPVAKAPPPQVPVAKMPPPPQAPVAKAPPPLETKPAAAPTTPVAKPATAPQANAVPVAQPPVAKPTPPANVAAQPASAPPAAKPALKTNSAGEQPAQPAPQTTVVDLDIGEPSKSIFGSIKSILRR